MERIGWAAVGVCVLLTLGFGTLAATIAPGAVNAAVGTALAAIVTFLIVAGSQVYDALTEKDGE